VDAEIEESSVEDVARAEDIIVSQWEGLPVSAREIRERIDEVLRPLGVQTSLVVIRRANSLALTFICLTLSAFMSLRDQWSSGSLKDIVQSLFTVLSSAAHVVHVKRLSWSQAYCLEFFSSSQGKSQL